MYSSESFCQDAMLKIPTIAGLFLIIECATRGESNGGCRLGNYFQSSTEYEHVVLAANGRLYAAPWNARRLLEVDPVTGSVQCIGPDLGSEAFMAAGMAGLIISRQ